MLIKLIEIDLAVPVFIRPFNYLIQLGILNSVPGDFNELPQLLPTHKAIIIFIHFQECILNFIKVFLSKITE